TTSSVLPASINRLITILHRLRDAGNTLLVVEHDPDVIRAADRVIDMGPGPGERGGEIVFYGTVAELLKCKRSRTGQAMLLQMSPPPKKKKRKAESGTSRARRARGVSSAKGARRRKA